MGLENIKYIPITKSVDIPPATSIEAISKAIDTDRKPKSLQECFAEGYFTPVSTYLTLTQEDCRAFVDWLVGNYDTIETPFDFESPFTSISIIEKLIVDAAVSGNLESVLNIHSTAVGTVDGYEANSGFLVDCLIVSYDTIGSRAHIESIYNPDVESRQESSHQALCARRRAEILKNIRYAFHT